MKTMNTKTLSAMAVLAFSLSAKATSRDVAWMGNVELWAVNHAKIVETNGAYLMKVELTIRNKGAEGLMLRNGAFNMVLEACEPAAETADPKATRASGQKPEPKIETIEVGTAMIDEVELPASNGGKVAGTTNKVVTVYLGSTHDEETTAKAMRIINALGSPTNTLTVLFKGIAEIGLKVPHGWVFELGKRYELDLRFTPTIQRRVLFG